MGPRKAKRKLPDIPAATQTLLAREQPFSFVCRVPEGKPAKKAILLLHGMFHNANAMLRAAREDIRIFEPDAALYALNAPFPADPEQHLPAQKPRNGAGFRLWYELPRGKLYPRREILPPMQIAVRHVQRMISQIKRTHGLRESQIHIIAFSQGCAPALQAATERERNGRPLASLALLCGNAWDPAIFPATADMQEEMLAPKIQPASAPPPARPEPAPPVAAEQRWFDGIVRWALRKRDASEAAKAAVPEPLTVPDAKDEVTESTTEARAEAKTEQLGRTPVFYAFVEQDDTVPIALSWYTATFMRAHKMNVSLHISPSYVQDVNIARSRLVGRVRIERPSYLRFRTLLLRQSELANYQPANDAEQQLPAGHFYVRRERSLTHFSVADDGFGNQVTKLHDMQIRLVIDSHWVNPSIRQALILWHAHGLLDLQSGVIPLQRSKLPKITQEQVEYGWAFNHYTLDVNKPRPLPAWLRPTHTFNSIRAELRHLFWAYTAQAAISLSRPVHHYFFHEPDPNERTFHEMAFNNGKGKAGDKRLTAPERAAQLKLAKKHFEQLSQENEEHQRRKSRSQKPDLS